MFLSSFSFLATLGLLITCQSCCQGASESSQCHYKGYAPGGRVPQLSRIKTTPVKFEETVLDNVIDYFGDAVEFPKGVLDVIGSVKNALPGAPVMSAALGIFAAALEISNQEASSPNAILAKVQESVDLLADEVNTRLDQMKDYVDSSLARNERERMTKNFRKLTDRWVNCGNAAPGRDSDQCQIQAEELISSERFDFQELNSRFENPKYNPKFTYRNAATWQWMEKNKGKHVWPLSHAEVRKLEASLIPFRNYATLHIIVMETLAMTYKSEGKESCDSYKYYLNKVAEKADYYIRYAEWAYEWIYIRQYEENAYFGVSGRTGGPASLERGGYLGTIQCKGSTCTAECSQMISDNLCTLKNARKRATLRAKLSSLCDTYVGEVKKQVVEFWTSNLLNVVERWKKYRDVAKERLAAIKC